MERADVMLATKAERRVVLVMALLVGRTSEEMEVIGGKVVALAKRGVDVGIVSLREGEVVFRAGVASGILVRLARGVLKVPFRNSDGADAEASGTGVVAFKRNGAEVVLTDGAVDVSLTKRGGVVALVGRRVAKVRFAELGSVAVV